jgi:hypothetical protein
MVLRSRVRTLVAVTSVTLTLPILASASHAQLNHFSKQELTEYSARNPFERLPDGRPKVPDALIERARELSAEDVWVVLQDKGYNNQYADAGMCWSSICSAKN